MEKLLEWQYLIFELPMIAAIVFILLTAFSGIEVGDSDIDVDVEHGGHVDHDMNFDHHGDQFLVRALSVLGLGKVPLSIIIITFCLIWGFVGFFSNRILEGILPLPIIYGPISMGIAFFASMFATGYVAGLVSTIMPKTETYATTSTDLIGRRGEVIHTITATTGTVRVRDAYQNILDIPCRIQSGKEVLGPQQNVVVLNYDEEQKIYLVGKDNLDSVTS